MRLTVLSQYARGVAHHDQAEGARLLASNAGSLINYGERYRSGERISSCLAESTVHAVISKRFAKRQQMQWTKRGAHLPLQTRIRTRDGMLRSLFERWYPGLADDNGAGRDWLGVVWTDGPSTREGNQDPTRNPYNTESWQKLGRFH